MESPAIPGSADLPLQIATPNSLLFRASKTLLYCLCPFAAYAVLIVFHYILSTPLLFLAIGFIALVIAYVLESLNNRNRQPPPPQTPQLTVTLASCDHPIESGDSARQQSDSVPFVRSPNPPKRNYLYADLSNRNISIMHIKQDMPSAEFMVAEESIDAKEIVQLHPPVAELVAEVKSAKENPNQLDDSHKPEVLPEIGVKDTLRYVPLVYHQTDWSSQDQIVSLTTMLDKSSESEEHSSVTTANNNILEGSLSEKEPELSLPRTAMDTAVTAEGREPSTQSIVGNPPEPVAKTVDHDDTYITANQPFEGPSFQNQIAPDNASSPDPDINIIVGDKNKNSEDLQSDVNSNQKETEGAPIPLVDNTEPETDDITIITEVPTTSLLESVLQYFPLINQAFDFSGTETQTQIESDHAICDSANNNANEDVTLPEVADKIFEAKDGTSETLSNTVIAPKKEIGPVAKAEDVAIPFATLLDRKFSSMNPMVLTFDEDTDDSFHLAVDHPELFVITSEE